jgi:hypothetical protein
MNQQKRQFLQGVAYSAAEMARAFDQPGYAIHLLGTAGLTSAKALRAAQVDEYDAKVCRRVLKDERR